MKLRDLSPMPFGKYEGTPMQDVEVSYLHWYWHNVKAWNETGLAVMDYIKENLQALKEENDDLIWSKK
jgi:uncharacterized protein (DUF3820 family)